MMLWLMIVLLIIGVRSDERNFDSEDYNQEHYVEEQDEYTQDNTYIHNEGRNVIINRGTKKSYTDSDLIAEKEAQLKSIPGDAGKDYPMLDRIPRTSFRCKHRHPGYYADQEANCQVFHVCSPSGHKTSFLCPNGSIFNQRYLVCDWWYDFDCSTATEFYVTPAPIFKLFQAFSSSSPNEENYHLLQNLDPANIRYDDLNVAHSGGNTGQTEEFDQLPVAQNNNTRFDQGTDRYNRANFVQRNTVDRAKFEHNNGERAKFEQNTADRFDRARFNNNTTERYDHPKFDQKTTERTVRKFDHDRARFDQNRRNSENRSNGVIKQNERYNIPDGQLPNKSINYDQRLVGHENRNENFHYEKNANGNDDAKKFLSTDAPMVQHQYSNSGNADLRNTTYDSSKEYNTN